MLHRRCLDTDGRTGEAWCIARRMVSGYTGPSKASCNRLDARKTIRMVLRRVRTAYGMAEGIDYVCNVPAPR